MTSCAHHILGVFMQREEAQGALDALIGRGMAAEQLSIFSAVTAVAGSGAAAEACGGQPVHHGMSMSIGTRSTSHVRTSDTASVQYRHRGRRVTRWD